MPSRSLTIACLCALLLFPACDGSDSGSAAVATEVKQGKTAESLQLAAVVELVKGEGVADAKTLEAKINDPEAKLAAVDIDADGKVDFIEVVEKKKGGKTTLVLQAIPSSESDEKKAAKQAVVVAEVELYVENKEKIVVHAEYSEHIDHDATIHVYHHEQPAVYEGDVLVVADGCFFHYAFVDVHHEVYLGHHHHGVVIIDDHHHKHFKHKKHKKGKGHHKGHGGHGVVVTW